MMVWAYVSTSRLSDRTKVRRSLPNRGDELLMPMWLIRLKEYYASSMARNPSFDDTINMITR